MTACCQPCPKRQSNSKKIIDETDLLSDSYDGILLVVPPIQEFIAAAKFASIIKTALGYDPSLKTEVTILPLPDVPAGRLVYSPTGPLDPDYDDVRSLKEAANKGVKRAVKAGIKKLLVVLEDYTPFENSELITLLAVLQSAYVPLQERETHPANAQKFDLLGVYTACGKKSKHIANLANILESGLLVARDIGGSDPERMTPINIQKYVQEAFSKSPITVSVIDDPGVFAREYPLFEAVNRAAHVVERHRGRIIYLEYNPCGQVTRTVMLVGKGVTYDTGGSDIKTGGAMMSMSRDKCGAASVAGFMKIVSELRPPNVRVVAALSLVRNSVGSNGYVADELIVSRSKATVRIGNTDAEGRMIMADVLCRMKEMAITAINPHLLTVATLTGHAILTAGTGVSIVLDNGPARKCDFAKELQKHGDAMGDLFEISRLRREDFAFHRGQTEGDDVYQSANAPSAVTKRGHQGPPAFLILASGLDKHGTGSQFPLKYSHCDIAAATTSFPHPFTGCAILALVNTFLLH